MTKLLLKLFVKEYQNTGAPKVRSAIGMIYSHEEACFLYKGGGLRERKWQ